MKRRGFLGALATFVLPAPDASLPLLPTPESMGKAWVADPVAARYTAMTEQSRMFWKSWQSSASAYAPLIATRQGRHADYEKTL